jgi:GPH family glycoside/pentoside/hexuronide:cation symporter
VLSVVAFLMLFLPIPLKSVSRCRRAPPPCGEDLRDIWRNDQWRIVGVLTILNILAVCVRGGAMMYYCTWIMGSPEIRRSSPPTASAT